MKESGIVNEFKGIKNQTTENGLIQGDWCKTSSTIKCKDTYAAFSKFAIFKLRLNEIKQQFKI